MEIFQGTSSTLIRDKKSCVSFFSYCFQKAAPIILLYIVRTVDYSFSRVGWLGEGGGGRGEGGAGSGTLVGSE